LDYLTQNEYGVGPLHELKHYIKGTSENVANVVTWGGTDFVGDTNTSNYNVNDQGESTSFGWQEGFFVTGRESAITALTLGVGNALQLARAGNVSRTLFSVVGPRNLVPVFQGRVAYEALQFGSLPTDAWHLPTGHETR